MAIHGNIVTSLFTVPLNVDLQVQVLKFCSKGVELRLIGGEMYLSGKVYIDLQRLSCVDQLSISDAQ